MTLKEIKDFMLNRLPKSRSKDFGYYNGNHYDDDGHCSSTAYLKIINFWENFDNDRSFLYLVSGEFVTDLDLSGGRSYLLPEEELAPMCVKYLVNNLGYTYEEFDKIIYNSTELNELIDDLFQDKSYIRDIKIKEVLKEETTPINIWQSYNFEIPEPEKNTFVGWIKKYQEGNNF